MFFIKFILEQNIYKKDIAKIELIQSRANN